MRDASGLVSSQALRATPGRKAATTRDRSQGTVPIDVKRAHCARAGVDHIEPAVASVARLPCSGTLIAQCGLQCEPMTAEAKIVVLLGEKVLAKVILC
jgi:hypothetical protein